MSADRTSGVDAHKVNFRCKWSGRADLNCRPLAPQAVTLICLPFTVAPHNFTLGMPLTGGFCPFWSVLFCRHLPLFFVKGPHKSPHSFSARFSRSRIAEGSPPRHRRAPLDGSVIGGRWRGGGALESARITQSLVFNIKCLQIAAQCEFGNSNISTLRHTKREA